MTKKDEKEMRDCVERGGHCWKDTGYRTASIPPIATERCRHCPASRTAWHEEGHDFNGTRYGYPDGQP